MDKSTNKKYKRPAIDEDIYYEMAENAVRKRVSIKQWLEEAIKDKLKKERGESNP